MTESTATDGLALDASCDERDLIGACIISPSLVPKVRNALRVTDFGDQTARAAWTVLESLDKRGVSALFTSVCGELARLGKTQDFQAGAVLLEWAAAVPTLAHVDWQIAKIQAASTRRKLLRSTTEITAVAQDGILSADDAVRRAEEIIGKVGTDRALAESAGPLDRAMIAHQATMERLEGGDARALAFGLEELDRLTSGGARPGQLVVIGGRPGMGKSAILRAMARSFAKRGPVLFASNEMSARDLADRDLANASGVSLETITAGRYSDAELEALTTAAGQIGEQQIWDHADGSMTSAGLRAYATELRATVPYVAIVVDYLQRMSDPGRDDVARVGHTARALKSLAMDLDVPVLTGSQLSRTTERESPDRRPTLIDLRTTGEIEQEADIVLLLYRESYHYRTEQEWRQAKRRAEGERFAPNRAEVIIAKQRQGSSGVTAYVAWLPALASFRNLARDAGMP